ncbi:MAG: hypothetical protein AXA67_10205 [Methylothermaceae bacteria B42]|nr:MAG: hypothetical protein AXA67_10205 [Methylothermaceae bacteria B42]HHJ40558.1 hypothetical protein [Methylothermaceae bacterium]
MSESNLYYAGTETPVLPGDKIRIRRILRPDVYATVTYIPGINKFNPEMGNDQWSYKIDNGDYYVVGYDPLNKNYTSKKISLSARANKKDHEKYKSFSIPPEVESDSSILGELLWLFGLSVIIFLVIFVFKVIL